MPGIVDGTLFGSLKSERAALTNWLCGSALPLWAGRGVDRENGGFYERMAQDGRVIDDPRRTRLVARQTYVFATAAEMGWTDAQRARELVFHGLDFLFGKCATDIGLAHAAVSPAGEPVDPEFRLYDHAFFLFSLGVSARLDYQCTRATNAGRRMLREMVRLRKHPQGGFEESVPPSKQLNANPHMHLLEACLEWEAADIEGPWRAISDELVELALTRFIDAETGCLREHYDHDWKPAPGENGRLLEPGHHFEWAWLLWRWGRARDRADAFCAARRLVTFGELNGVNTATGLAVNVIWDDASLHDGDSRLWPQTERIKAHIAMAELARDQAEFNHAMRCVVEAVTGLQRYFRTDIPGLWHETLDRRGERVLAPARASSFYHIVCAIRELDGFVNSYV